MKAKLNYPKEFQTLPEHHAHDGQIVEVVRALSLSEADFHSDPELERMFVVRAEDGWEGDVFETELEFYPCGEGDFLAFQVYLDRLVKEAAQ